MIPSDPTNFEPFAGEEPDDMNVVKVHASLLRERAEPGAGAEPISTWLIALFMAITFFAGLYLAFNSGGFSANVFNPSAVSWSGGGGGPAAPPDPKVIGKRLFTANCVVCHQSTGAGVAGQFPPLAGSEWVLSQDWHGDNHLVKIVLKGLQGVVTVKGAQFNNAMPPWEMLKDEQVAAILTYVRSEWGNNAPPITKEFVAKIRESTKSRTEPWSQNDLKAIGRELISEAKANPAPASASGPPAQGSGAPPEQSPPAPAPQTTAAPSAG